MTEDSAKIDALGQQIGVVLVQLATVATQVAGVRDDLARMDDRHADHEARLRVVEAHNTADHGQRLTALERWRWSTAGIAAGSATLAATVVAAVGRLIGHG